MAHNVAVSNRAEFIGCLARLIAKIMYLDEKQSDWKFYFGTGHKTMSGIIIIIVFYIPAFKSLKVTLHHLKAFTSCLSANKRKCRCMIINYMEISNVGFSGGQLNTVCGALL